MITNTQNMSSKSALRFLFYLSVQNYFGIKQNILLTSHALGPAIVNQSKLILWTCITSLCLVHLTFLLGRTRCIVEKICLFHGAMKFSNPKDS